MDTPDRVCPSLSLRFRHGEEPETACTAAFLGAVRGDVVVHDEPIAVAAPPEPSPPDDVLRIFFQAPAYPIPSTVRLGSTAALPELGSWCLRPTAFGYVAEVPTERSTSRAASWVLAAALPLAFAIPKLASARDAAPTVQRPKSKAPKLPDPEPTPPVEPETPPEAAPASDEVPTDAPPTDVPAAEEPVAPTSDPFTAPPPPPAPVLDEEAILDAAWEGVDGFDVDLRLKGGEKMRGRVGAVQKDTFTLIQDETGAVLVLPKSGVRALRVRVPPAVPTRTGGGAIAAGVALTTIGAPVFITGVVFLAVCPSCAYLHLPMLFIGGGAMGGGIPLLVRGARRRDAWRNAVTARGLSASVGPTRNGWSGGMRFRF